MRCPSCGESVSKMDDSCPYCNTLLRYEDPRGTLQDQEHDFGWTERHTRLLLILIVIGTLVMGVIALLYFLFTP